MADRTMIQGDTYPPLRGAASDEDGLLDLTTATSLQVRMRAPLTGGGYALITGAAVADTPPVQEGNLQCNWHYNFATGDTAQIGAYNVELVATFTGGKQTFTGPTLAVIEGSTS